MDKTLAEEYLKQGITLFNLRKFENAISYFKKAEIEDAFNINVYIHMGVSYFNLEQYEEAEKSFQKSLKINKEEGIIYFHLGNICFIKGESKKGLQYYNTAIGTGCEESQMYFNLGMMFEEEGDHTLAIRNYSKAIHCDPSREDVRIRKAQLFIKNKHFDEALQSIEEMIAVNHDNVEGFHLKILVLISKEEYKKAQHLLDILFEKYPKEVRFIFDQATLHISTNRFEDAFETLKKVEKVNDNEINKHAVAIEHAKIFALKMDTKNTIFYLEEAKKISEKMKPTIDLETTFFLMNCYLNIEDYTKAITCAKELKQKKEDSYYELAAYYYEPLCLLKLGYDNEANDLFEKAVELFRSFTLKNPNSIDGYVFRILCLKELKQLDKALELADYLVMIMDEIGETHIVRAAILTDMKRENEASMESAKAQSLSGILAG